MAYKVKKDAPNVDIYTKEGKIELKEATQKQLKELFDNHKDLIDYIDEGKSKKSKKKDSE